jgi:transcriptional regulator with XRE-family HTH domain
MSRAVTPYDVRLGLAVRTARRQAGMAQGELARRIGVASQQIQKYETAANRIAVSTLVDIAGALDTSPASLMGLADAPVALSPADLEMLATWRRLRSEDQATALKLFASLARRAGETG